MIPVLKTYRVPGTPIPKESTCTWVSKIVIPILWTPGSQLVHINKKCHQAIFPLEIVKKSSSTKDKLRYGYLGKVSLLYLSTDTSFI
jgi:hypothetical protein